MISIIIPYYNTEKYFKKCLSSIKAQTFSDFEALLINDGSTDNCLEIAKEFANSDPRFKLLGDKHIGFPYSKNLGLDNAKGEYIAFVDSDDYVEPTYLEELYNTLIETNTDISCCQIYRFKDKEPNNIERIKDKKTTIYIDDKMDALLNIDVTTYMWNKLYKRELFDGIRFKDVEALSDTMEMPKIFTKAKSVSLINFRLINYRIHHENMTYNVRNFSPTYWEHRMNVQIDFCCYIYDNYPQTRGKIKRRLELELQFIKPHLDKMLYNKYTEDPKVKEILAWKKS